MELDSGTSGVSLRKSPGRDRELSLGASLLCVLGMGIDYRVKVPNSHAGGKSQRIARWSE